MSSLCLCNGDTGNKNLRSKLVTSGTQTVHNSNRWCSSKSSRALSLIKLIIKATSNTIQECKVNTAGASNPVRIPYLNRETQVVTFNLVFGEAVTSTSDAYLFLWPIMPLSGLAIYLPKPLE